MVLNAADYFKAFDAGRAQHAGSYRGNLTHFPGTGPAGARPDGA